MSGRAPASPQESKPNPLPTEERIRQRAHDLYLQRDGRDGSELEDWLQAEAEIQAEDKEA